MSLLSWWKILDNLRRSLVPFALTLLLLAGWTILSSPWFWTLVVIWIILIPSMIPSVVYLIQKPDEVLLRQHIKGAAESVLRQLYQSAFVLVSLPYEAYYSLDALLRTCWRLIISKKRLLEWNSATKDEYLSRFELIESFRTMWASPLVSILTAASLFLFFPITLLLIWPILGLWFIFPVIVWWISKPIVEDSAKLSDIQVGFLRELSRKTWSFFETFVGTDDNWLPPDNYQEHPVSVIAHRTSPTNMGLSLLANLSAYDFGYIFTGELLSRTDNAFITMQSLERYQGHFFNWYDTQSLKPLRPLYISSVDSGNLAGHLLTLQQGLLSLPDDLIPGSRVFEGIDDTLQILINKSGKSITDEIIKFRRYLNAVLKEYPDSIGYLFKCLEKLSSASTEIVNKLDSNSGIQYGIWAKSLLRQCRSAYDELRHLVPWLLHPYSSEIQDAFPGMNSIPTLREIGNWTVSSIEVDLGDPKINLEVKGLFREAVENAKERIEKINSLISRSGAFADMGYEFLYDTSTHLQTVGYNVDDRRRDSSYYDLLASEARLSSFVAIAQDQIPQESWFALGRLLTTIDGEPILLSWSGSMFEYLMPLIIMPEYENSLLYQTCKSAVKRQIEYGKLRGVPWGISESGYNSVDVQQNYQYRAFGVPGLGLKRGLSEDLVIAPYATALALMVMPTEACDNLERLAGEGFLGEFGFYEAIDYTSIRLPRGQTKALIRSFMAHHEGMSFLSLAYILLNRKMQKRFESSPIFQATLLLLQEKIPTATTYFSHTSAFTNVHPTTNNQEAPFRIFDTPDTTFPEVNLLSNEGRYRVMITNSGGGYSRWKDIAVTRWREDSTLDNWGAFCYIRDAENGNFWSATYQPTLKKGRKI